MTATSQQQHIATPDFFNDNDLPPRGFLGDIIAVITRPIEFFMTFDVQRMSKHTLWMALLILVIVAANTLQMRAPAVDSAPQDINVPPMMEGEMFGEGGMPFDPSMMGGNIGGEGTSEADDPAADWTTPRFVPRQRMNHDAQLHETPPRSGFDQDAAGRIPGVLQNL